jgi:hypothetical protein
MVQAQGSGEAMTTRATAAAGKDGGRPAPEASAKAAPCRAGALRARRADARRSAPLPLGRWQPAVTRPPAPRVKQRLTVDEQKLTTEADHNGIEIGPMGPCPTSQY